jgi:hypothetical protein
MTQSTKFIGRGLKTKLLGDGLVYVAANQTAVAAPWVSGNITAGLDLFTWNASTDPTNFPKEAMGWFEFEFNVTFDVTVIATSSAFEIRFRYIDDTGTQVTTGYDYRLHMLTNNLGNTALASRRLVYSPFPICAIIIKYIAGGTIVVSGGASSEHTAKIILNDLNEEHLYSPRYALHATSLSTSANLALTMYGNYEAVPGLALSKNVSLAPDYVDATLYNAVPAFLRKNPFIKQIMTRDEYFKRLHAIENSRITDDDLKKGYAFSFKDVWRKLGSGLKKAGMLTDQTRAIWEPLLLAYPEAEIALDALSRYGTSGRKARSDTVAHCMISKLPFLPVPRTWGCAMSIMDYLNKIDVDYEIRTGDDGDLVLYADGEWVKTHQFPPRTFKVKGFCMMKRKPYEEDGDEEKLGRPGTIQIHMNSLSVDLSAMLRCLREDEIEYEVHDVGGFYVVPKEWYADNKHRFHVLTGRNAYSMTKVKVPQTELSFLSKNYNVVALKDALESEGVSYELHEVGRYLSFPSEWFLENRLRFQVGSQQVGHAMMAYKDDDLTPEELETLRILMQRTSSRQRKDLGLVISDSSESEKVLKVQEVSNWITQHKNDQTSFLSYMSGKRNKTPFAVQFFPILLEEKQGLEPEVAWLVVSKDRMVGDALGNDTPHDYNTFGNYAFDLAFGMNSPEVMSFYMANLDRSVFDLWGVNKLYVTPIGPRPDINYLGESWGLAFMMAAIRSPFLGVLTGSLDPSSKVGGVAMKSSKIKTLYALNPDEGDLSGVANIDIISAALFPDLLSQYSEVNLIVTIYNLGQVASIPYVNQFLKKGADDKIEAKIDLGDPSQVIGLIEFNLQERPDDASFKIQASRITTKVERGENLTDKEMRLIKNMEDLQKSRIKKSKNQSVVVAPVTMTWESRVSIPQADGATISDLMNAIITTMYSDLKPEDREFIDKMEATRDLGAPPSKKQGNRIVNIFQSTGGQRQKSKGKAVSQGLFNL